MHGNGPHQGGGQLSDGDKALVIKANSLSGNVVVLRATGVQDTAPGVQDAAPGVQDAVPGIQDTATNVQDTAPDTENAG